LQIAEKLLDTTHLWRLKEPLETKEKANLFRPFDLDVRECYEIEYFKNFINYVENVITVQQKDGNLKSDCEQKKIFNLLGP